MTLEKVSVGTELNIVQEGLSDIIPMDACYLEWLQSTRKSRKARGTGHQAVTRRRRRTRRS